MSNWCELPDLLTSRRPERQLVAFRGTRHWYWQNWYAEVRAMASHLQNRPERRIALVFRDSYQFSVALFACFGCRRVPVLPGSEQPGGLIKLAAGYDLLLVDDDFAGAGIACCRISQLMQMPAGAVPEFQALSPCSTLTLYTSGSSGHPKEVSKRIEQLQAELQDLEQLWGGLLAGCRIISSVSHQHIYGLLFRVLWPLCAGRAFSSEQLLLPDALYREASPEHALISSPAVLERLPAEMDLNPYRIVFSSGGALSLRGAEQSGRIFGQRPIEVLGSTETGGIAWRQQTGARASWQRLPGVEVDILDGNLLVRSPYLDDPKRFHATGDKAEADHAQSFRLLGRTDRVVKLEQKRISLVEVETALAAIEGIQDAAVVPIWRGDRQVLGAVLVLEAATEQRRHLHGTAVFWGWLREQLRPYLPAVALPRQVRVVSSIPVNAQGKRTEQQLKALFDDE